MRSPRFLSRALDRVMPDAPRSGGISRTLRPVSFSGPSWTHEGANYTRRRSLIWTQATDAKKTQGSWVRSQLLSRARYLFNNLGLARGAIFDIGTYAFGDGLKPKSLAKEVEIRRAYEDYFLNWCKICDFYGRYSLGTLSRLASIAADVDGDIGFAMVKNEFGLRQLQPILGHRIRNGRTDDKNVFDGVVTDDKARPVAYRVILDSDETPLEISARNFILLLDPDRMDAFRGLSSLATACNSLQDIFETLESEKLAIKQNSQISVIETNEAGEMDPLDAFNGTTTVVSGNKEFYTQESEDGQTRFIRAGTGGSISAHQFTRPGSTFVPFLEHIARDFAASIRLPYDYIWNAEKLNGTVNRFVMQKAQRRFDERQAFFAHRLYSRCWGWVIAGAIKDGDLPDSPDWWKVRWQGPAKMTVDVGREAQQNRADIIAGIRSGTEDADERGHDFMQLRDDIELEARDLIARAQKMAKDTNTDFNLCLNLLSQRNANGNLPATTEPPPSNS